MRRRALLVDIALLPFNQMQFLARSLIVSLRVEVRLVDNERIALPMATRVAKPLADVRRWRG
jgi:hypothetical protein